MPTNNMRFEFCFIFNKLKSHLYQILNCLYLQVLRVGPWWTPDHHPTPVRWVEAMTSILTLLVTTSFRAGPLVILVNQSTHWIPSTPWKKVSMIKYVEYKTKKKYVENKKIWRNRKQHLITFVYKYWILTFFMTIYYSILHYKCNIDIDPLQVERGIFKQARKTYSRRVNIQYFSSFFKKKPVLK